MHPLELEQLYEDTLAAVTFTRTRDCCPEDIVQQMPNLLGTLRRVSGQKYHRPAPNGRDDSLSEAELQALVWNLRRFKFRCEDALAQKGLRLDMFLGKGTMSEENRQTRVDVLSKLARDALLVQDACNLKGVIVAFSRARDLILEHGGREKGTEWFNHHPIMRLYASKIHSLTGLGLSDGPFDQAYDLCCRMAEGEGDCY